MLLNKNMIQYIIAGFSIFVGVLYYYKPNIFYRYTISASIFMIRNVIWLKQLKQKFFNNKTEILYKNKIKLDELSIYEFELKKIDINKNYNNNYILKYIINNDEIKDERKEMNEMKNKLLKLYDIELLHEKLNKILHCSFYWEEDPDVLIDLTNDLRHFILYFECDKTTMFNFLKYMINNYKLNIDSNNEDKCGLYIIKNDDMFSEVRITLENSKDITFKEIFNS